MIGHSQVRVRVGPIDGFYLIRGSQIIEANFGEMAILGGLNNPGIDLQRNYQLTLLLRRADHSYF